MIGSITSAFSEPEDFAAALRGEGCAVLLITGHGEFRAQLTQVTLHHLCLSAAEEQLSRIAFVAAPADTLVISFPIGSGTLPICGGTGLQPDEMMILTSGEQVHMRTNGVSRWGNFQVPVRELARYGSALEDAGDLQLSRDDVCVAFMRPRSGWPKLGRKHLSMPEPLTGWSRN
jgi:hypothetical protein